MMNKKIITIILLLSIFAGVTLGLVGSFKIVKVRSVSMIPILNDGDIVIVRKRKFGWNKPELRNKIVVFEGPRGNLMIKKCIAVSGDTISFSNLGIFSNGVNYYSADLKNNFRISFSSDERRKEFEKNNSSFVSTGGHFSVYHGVIGEIAASADDLGIIDIAIAEYYPHFLSSISANVNYSVPDNLTRSKTDIDSIQFHDHNPDYNLFVLGNNLGRSSDSRNFGEINVSKVVGVVVLILNKTKKKISRYSVQSEPPILD